MKNDNTEISMKYSSNPLELTLIQFNGQNLLLEQNQNDESDMED